MHLATPTENMAVRLLRIFSCDLYQNGGRCHHFNNIERAFSEALVTR